MRIRQVSTITSHATKSQTHSDTNTPRRVRHLACTFFYGPAQKCQHCLGNVSLLGTLSRFKTLVPINDPVSILKSAGTTFWKA